MEGTKPNEDTSTVEIKSVFPKVNVDKIMKELEIAVTQDIEPVPAPARNSPTFEMAALLPPKHRPPKVRRHPSKPASAAQKQSVEKLFETVRIHRPPEAKTSEPESKVIPSSTDSRSVLSFSKARAGDEGVLFAESLESPLSLVIAKCIPPRAPVHFLVVVRDLSLLDVSFVKKEHLDLIRKMESRARLLLNLHCRGEGRIGFRLSNEAKFTPLHLHVLGGDQVRVPFLIITPQELIAKWTSD